MRERAGRNVTVGTFATLAFVVLAVVVMTIGGDSHLARGTTFRTTFSNTDGLRTGSPVKMAGVQVGTVRDVRLPADFTHPGIEVVLMVGTANAQRVREDSKASLRYLQVLSGEKYVEITPGSPQASALAEGGTVEPVNERELLQQGADIAGNINEITVSLKNILAPLERGEGLLGAMLYDPEFGKEGLAHLKASLENVEGLTAQLRAGKGFAGRLLFDPEFAKQVDRISVTLDRLALTMDSVSRREGAVGALLNEGGSGQAAIEDLRASAASLRKATDRLTDSEGLIGKLLYDREYSEAMARDLRETLANVASITRKIDSGDGTLGALLNERTLHDGMEEVVAGVGDSKFARWLMRHYQKKGIEMEPAPAAPSPQP